MTLYTRQDCEPCEKVKKFIAENNLNIDLVELNKTGDKYVKKTEAGYEEVGVNVFPTLSLVDDNSVMIGGEEGCIEYMTKGYFHRVKRCPYFSTANCLETNCEKFVVMAKGPLNEGSCSDYMNSILLSEISSILSRIDKRGLENAK